VPNHRDGKTKRWHRGGEGTGTGKKKIRSVAIKSDPFEITKTTTRGREGLGRRRKGLHEEG